MAFLPECTWYNILIVVYFAGTAILAFKGQQKAEEGAVVWSKFAIGKVHKFPISARVGMLAKYVPAFTIITLKVAVFTFSLGLMESMMLIHFGKRILEVLYLHDFSGSPTEDGTSSFFIGLFYAFAAWLYCRDGSQASTLVLDFGVMLFCIGIVGNFYHHLILARLRTPGYKGPSDASGKYKLPSGGFFDLTSCPHYLFEILGFWGAAIAAFNLITFSMAINTTMMLTGHAMSTTRWYQSKFGKLWPEERKHIIPYIF
jgi:very-long-chain enoyl-CoA reductase